jgi:hypothetical protein
MAIDRLPYLPIIITIEGPFYVNIIMDIERPPCLPIIMAIGGPSLTA